MKLIIDSAHREYFQTVGYIQFENVFSPEVIAFVNTHFEANKRDSWRTIDLFNKKINQRQLGKFVADLTGNKTVRLGYDQFLEAPVTYPPESSIQEISCLQGILCGMLVCLTDKEEIDEVFPTKAGDATFLLPNTQVDWEQLNSGRYLLIVYTHERGVYHREDNDPHTHALKQLGYTFGDRLKDDYHPIIYT